MKFSSNNQRLTAMCCTQADSLLQRVGLAAASSRTEIMSQFRQRHMGKYQKQIDLPSGNLT